MPDPKIRQRKFDWAEPEVDFTGLKHYNIDDSLLSKTATGSNAMVGNVLTKSAMLKVVDMLKQASFKEPMGMIVHPFVVNDLLLDSTQEVVVDFETVEKSVINQWLEGTSWEKEFASPSPSSLSV